jgi:hypothetical protein
MKTLALRCILKSRTEYLPSLTGMKSKLALVKSTDEDDCQRNR